MPRTPWMTSARPNEETLRNLDIVDSNTAMEDRDDQSVDSDTVYVSQEQPYDGNAHERSQRGSMHNDGAEPPTATPGERAAASVLADMQDLAEEQANALPEYAGCSNPQDKETVGDVQSPRQAPEGDQGAEDVDDTELADEGGSSCSEWSPNAADLELDSEAEGEAEDELYNEVRQTSGLLGWRPLPLRVTDVSIEFDELDQELLRRYRLEARYICEEAAKRLGVPDVSGLSASDCLNIFLTDMVISRICALANSGVTKRPLNAERQITENDIKRYINTLLFWGFYSCSPTDLFSKKTIGWYAVAGLKRDFSQKRF